MLVGQGLFVLFATLATAPEGPDRVEAQEGELVDMVVAQVDEAVFTLSELRAEARLAILREKGPNLAETAALHEGLLRAVLSRMVHRELLNREVRRLQLPDPSEEEWAQAIGALRRSFDSAAQFDEFLETAGFRALSAEPGVAGSSVPSLLASILRAEQLAERFVELRVRGTAPVTDAEVRQCFEARRDEFEALSLSAAAPGLRTRLVQAREREALRRLIAELSSRATIRYIPPFEPQTDAEDLSDPCLPPS